MTSSFATQTAEQCQPFDILIYYCFDMINFYNAVLCIFSLLHRPLPDMSYVTCAYDDLCRIMARARFDL